MALDPQRSSLLKRKASPQFSQVQKGSSSFGNAAKAEGGRQGIKLIEEGFQGLAGFDETIASAEVLEFNARQETLIGEQQAATSLESLNDIQASNIVAAFASGIRLQGSVSRAQSAVGRKAGFNIALAKTNAAIRSGALEREARRRRAEAEYNRSVAPLKIVAGAIITYYSAGQA